MNRLSGATYVAICILIAMLSIIGVIVEGSAILDGARDTKTLVLFALSFIGVVAFVTGRLTRS